MHDYEWAFGQKLDEKRTSIRLTKRGKGLFLALGMSLALWAGILSAAWVVIGR